MSTHAARIPAGLTAESTSAHATKALTIGLIGIAITAIGLFVSGAHVVAMSWLVGVTYWTAMAIGMLMLILIHHIFDASWSVVLRRQFEHGLAAFKWLALLFSAAGDCLDAGDARHRVALDESQSRGAWRSHGRAPMCSI
jgi:hypothetical protein